MFVATADEITSSMKDRPEILHILSVDACIETNGMDHQTRDYEIMQQGTGLVVRRGQPLYLNVILSRNYNPRSDSIYLYLKMDVEQNIYTKNIKAPQVLVPLINSGQIKTCWVAAINSVVEHSIKLKVTVPDTAYVGKYHIQFDTFTKTTPSSSFSIKECLYIIFNPWCPDDKVYLNHEEHRQEYVMAEDGLIWTGHAGQINATPWSFCQFCKDVLDTAFHLINAKSNVDAVDRQDPIFVSGALATLVNGNDYDEGILLGKWDGHYADGKHPQSWLGSSDIIQEYLKEKKPVKYGQCWVYAGIFATLCRALGIPCRVVTNYESAHDTNDNLRVERCLLFRNFHVWNEIWMTRYDLTNERFHGWQVVDATPQGASTRNDSYRSQYTCGPFPVSAIKVGRPLPIQLTNRQFSILAPGLEKSLKIKLGSPVRPGTTVTCNSKCTTRRKSQSPININFQSNELVGVRDFLAATVVESAPTVDDSTRDGSSAIVGATGQPTMGFFGRFLQCITCNLLMKNK